VGNEKPRKYRNKKVTFAGITFDSQREFARWKELKLLEKAGEIAELELQPKFWLTCGGRPVLIRSKGYPKGRKSSFRADFRYYDKRTHERIVEDVKGYDTYRSRFRRAVVEAEYGIEIKIVR